MKNSSHYIFSISDLMVGILFIFILILIKFMIEYQTKKTSLLEPLIERNKLLEDLGNTMRKHKIKVDIDKENGVLKLKNVNYFSSGKHELSPQGKKDLKRIKEIFEKIICYSDLKNSKTKERWVKIYGEKKLNEWIEHCKRYKNKYALIDSILIEGHADSTPIGDSLKEEGIKTNLDLAMKRSQTVFEFLLDYKEATKTEKESGNYFYTLVNKKGKPLFGLTSYGNLRRNLKPHKLKKKKPGLQADRRIDIRFIMSQPEDIQKELKADSLK